MSHLPGDDELRAMALLSHPAAGVVQHVITAPTPGLGMPQSAAEPALDAARLRARIQVLEDWQHLAQCRNIDPALAVPVTDEVTPEMARACAQCPVRIECLAFGVERPEQPGILGGYPQSDRRKIRAMLIRGRSQR